LRHSLRNFVEAFDERILDRLPGRMKRSPTPRAYAQVASARPLNSGPLSVTYGATVNLQVGVAIHTFDDRQDLLVGEVAPFHWSSLNGGLISCVAD
jgi:hypothetical protein